jgi:peptide chain release factor subunit 1
MSINQLLDHLAGFEPTEFPVISLYLNAQPNEQGRDHFEPFIRSEFKAHLEKWPLRSEQRASYEQDIERISHYLREELRASANGIAIFACAGKDNFLEIVATDAPIEENSLYVLNTPFLYPLARLLDQYPYYATLIADTNSAHLYVFAEGEKQEQHDVNNANYSRTQKGGWSQARYQRHIDNFRLAHVKEVVEMLEQAVREDEIRWIVLAGDEVIIPKLREELPSQLSERVIDELRLDITTPEHGIREASWEAVRAYDAQHDQEKITKLFEEPPGRGLAAFGLRETLLALTMGQVQEVMLSDTPTAIQNNLETNDAALLPPLPDDISSEVRQVVIADEIIKQARRTGARVSFIENNELLNHGGGVAAQLRFSVEMKGENA